MSNIKEIILEIIEEDKDVNLDGVKVSFDDDIDELSLCIYTKYIDMFGRAFTVSDAIEVKFNTKAIEKNLREAFKTKSLIAKATKPYLKWLVFHEYRHVWQTKNDKAIIVATENYIGFDGYGKRPAEADANAFARSKASTKFECFIFDMFIYCQNMHNKPYRTKEDLVSWFKYSLKLYRYILINYLRHVVSHAF